MTRAWVRRGAWGMAWLGIGAVGSFLFAVAVAQFGGGLPWRPIVLLTDDAGGYVGALARGFGRSRLSLEARTGMLSQELLDQPERIREISSVGPWFDRERPVSDKKLILTHDGFGWPFPAFEYRRTATLEQSGFVEEKVGAWQLPAALGLAARDLPARPLWPGLIVDAMILGALLGGAFLAARWAGRGGRRARRRRGGRCLECGYALGGEYGGGCPECGWNRG